MSIRKPALDPSAAELARRRLSLLGAELSGPAPPAAADPAAADPAAAAPAAAVPAVAAPAAVPAAAPSAAAVPSGMPGSGAGADAAGPGGVVRAAAAGPVAPQARATARPGRHARARMSWSGRILGRAADALPPSLQGRVHVTAQHVTVVALTLTAAMALASWLLVRSAPRPEPPPRQASLVLPPGGAAVAAPVTSPAAGSQATDGAPVTAGGASDPAAAAVGGLSPAPVTAPAVVVHVTGKVRRPGVVELPAGARVIDAIDAVGGARPGARLGALNLARQLADGEQIAVGVPGAAVVPVPVGPAVPGTPAVLPVAGAPVNLNTASQAELEELPGVGPVTAASIIEWRTQHGAFSTVDELIEVSGIGEVTLAELRELVTV